ncbi:MAG: cytochrome bc complex cytochrome b subunit [Candidatus Latescibacteria bacterium]|nr:cytochrome bc complex cytochrome b subunit [Candidatus Latescibacterota bacterium]
MSRVRAALWQWLDQRFHLGPLADALQQNLRKIVPPHVNWLFTLGAMLAALLVVQLGTGTLLMVYYKPSSAQAHHSIEHLSYEVPLGWFIRSLHAWGSHLIVGLALLHLTRVYVYGGYKKPRELTWATGVLLLGLLLGFGFTGYLLPWDQVAYWATVVVTQAPASIPWVGPWMREFLIGGSEVADATLGRFFVVHVILLPLLLLGLMGLHLLLVRWLGISTLGRTDEPAPDPEVLRQQGGHPFVPYHLLKDLSAICAVLGLLCTLALLWPSQVGEPADPLRTPVGIKPDWYFLPAYQFLKYVPEALGVLAPPLFFLGLLFLPLFLDRSPERHPGRRPRALLAAALAGAFLLLLGVLGHLSETSRTFMGRTYHFDIRGWPQQVAPGEGP